MAKNKLDKILVTELVAQLQVEPSLAVVVVEGDDDYRVMLSFLRSQGEEDKWVYPISLVDADTALCKRHGLEGGSARRAVVALAMELGGACSSSARVACVVDSDLHTVLPDPYVSPFLLRTDFPAIESYAFDHAVLDRFATSYLGCEDVRPAKVVGALESDLKWLFSLRLARETAKKRVRFPGIPGCFNRSAPPAVLDRAALLSRWFDGDEELKAEILAASENWTQRLTGDSQLYAYGSDLVDLLVGMTGGLPNMSVATSVDQIRKVLLALLDPDQLARYGMFQKLLLRIRGGNAPAK